MKILVVHNRYKQAGGEDFVFKAETSLLREHGHEVIEYEADNHDVDHMNKLAVSVNTVWSRDSKAKMARVIAQHQPDIAHFHNTFMMISPSAYYACRAAGVPVVQTLHNYRLICPAAILFRDGHVCEECVGKAFAYPGIQHGCYRDSKLGTAVVAGMLTGHRFIGTWQNAIDRYIALTEFGRSKFIEGGLPAEKLVVKPNFLNHDPLPRTPDMREDYMLFLGRMTPEKGVLTLVEAWRILGDDAPVLKIAGEGPLWDEVHRRIAAYGLTKIEIYGQLARDEVLRMVKGAHAMIVPSEWYEAFGLVVIEGFASGVPVIGAKTGGPATIIEDGKNGLHFEPGSPQSLADAVRRMQTFDADAMGQTARKSYEDQYTAAANYAMLKQIYEDVLAERAKSSAT